METAESNYPFPELEDESFSNNPNGNYHFSVFAGEKDFSFSALDVKYNQYVALYSGLALQEAAEKIKQSGHMHSVSIAVCRKNFTLVPEAVFDENEKNKFLQFNCETENDAETLSDFLRLLRARNIYSVPKSFFDETGKMFPGAKFLHSSSCFIEGLLSLHGNNSAPQVFADFSRTFFTLVVLDGKTLLYSNAFSFAAPEDTAYYILFVLEQLDLNPDTTELVLSGTIGKNSKHFSLLHQYIRHVKFAALPGVFQYSCKLNGIQQHQYFSLFCQYLCG